MARKTLEGREVAMGFISSISLAHQFVKERINQGDTVIDATAGGGVDSLILAQLVGTTGQVYCFDIQQEALSQTEARINQARELNPSLAKVNYIQASHHLMDSYVTHKVKAIMFNLGYLPSGDHAIITLVETTIPALQSALSLLDKGGLITCMLYPGHPGGDIEAEEVLKWAETIPTTEAQVICYRQLQRKTAPFLIAIEKK